MDKIKTLLSKAGCNNEFVDQICEALESFKTTTKQRLEEEFKAKIEQAKKACIAETESHKHELARRLQIFCETKSASISSHLAKQMAISESEAVTKLRDIKSMLNGIVGLNGSGQNGQATAIKEMERRLNAVIEERNRSVETANRQTQIAEKVLKQNRVLVSENQRLKAQEEQPGAPLKESRNRASASKPKARLDQRSAGRPTTTRPTLVENQLRRQSSKQEPQGIVNNDVASIAAAIDEDL